MRIDPVYLRAASVTCTLGESLSACVATLQSGPQAPEPPEFPGYRRINDGAAPFDAGRMERLLERIVDNVVAEAGLTDRETRALPVFVGSSCFSIAVSEASYAGAIEQQPESAFAMPHCGYQDIGAAARRAFGGAGDTYAFNTACTSAANGLLSAARMVAIGEYRQALVVGAELANRTSSAGFAGLQLLTDVMRPFDARRAGLVLGEGIGALLISSDPGKAGAVRIAGGATQCDTSSVTTANPNGRSVASVLQAALRRSELTLGQVCGIKAHGTATSSGDAAEAAGLKQVFGDLPPVSALKPILGHTLGACGVVETALFAGALQAGFMPGAGGFGTPDPELAVRPLRAAAPAPHGYYLLNHFGFGGNNTVVVLEKRA